MAPDWVPSRIRDHIPDSPAGVLHWNVGCLHEVAPAHRALDRAENGYDRTDCEWNPCNKNEHVGMALQEQSGGDTQVK